MSDKEIPLTAYPLTIMTNGRTYHREDLYDALERQVEQLQAELHATQGFHDVAVKERNYERVLALKAQAEAKELKNPWVSVDEWGASYNDCWIFYKGEVTKTNHWDTYYKENITHVQPIVKPAPPVKDKG